MAEDRWNDSRNLWGEDRRRERERARVRDDDDGQPDYGYRSRRYDAPADDTGYRPFGDTGPVYTRSGAYTSEGRPYGEGRSYGASGRYEDMSPSYRDFDAEQRRLHRGDYDRDAYVPNPREGRGGEQRSWWDKTEDAVSSLFGDEHARRRREWDHSVAEAHGEHKGRGPRGYRRSDARMAEDINDRLTDDPHVDASDIEVSVKDGEATLSGTIYRREDKRRAEDIAEHVSGISHVQNNLRVKPYPGGISPASGDTLV
jgi:osmotically-inducible protein OsmY